VAVRVAGRRASNSPVSRNNSNSSNRNHRSSRASLVLRGSRASPGRHNLLGIVHLASRGRKAAVRVARPVRVGVAAVAAGAFAVAAAVEGAVVRVAPRRVVVAAASSRPPR
jgi:hypothetical protein